MRPLVRRPVARLLAGLSACAFAAMAVDPSAAVIAPDGPERVLDFDSGMRLGRDGTLEVIEAITVLSTGAQIVHGIHRDLPFASVGLAATPGAVEVVRVTRDGESEPWTGEPRDGEVELRIGRPDQALSLGTHRYEITYRVADRVAVSGGRAELRWPVTGSRWTLPIDRAAARLELPRRVPGSELAAEAVAGDGAGGSTIAVGDDAIRVETTRRLEPGEGLTLYASFPSTVVAAPGPWPSGVGFFAVGRGTAAGIVALAFAGTWLGAVARRRREPPPGPRATRDAPPAGYSPAAVRFVDRMACDGRCFAAALLGLGARGWLTIDHAATVSLRRTDGPAPAWFVGESPMAAALFEKGPALTLDRRGAPALLAARRALQRQLARQYDGVLFERNRGAVATAGAIGAVGLVLAEALDTSPLSMFLLAAALIVLLAVAWRKLPAYTAAGRAVRDQIDALRRYLADPTEPTPGGHRATAGTFARLLPYAYALDAERSWAARFGPTVGGEALAAAIAPYYRRVGPEREAAASVDGLLVSLVAMGGLVATFSTSQRSGSGGDGGGGDGGGGGGDGGGGGW